MPQQLADCQRETGVKGYLSSTVIDRAKRQVGHVQLGRRFDAAKEALVQCNDELLAGTLLFPRFDAQQHIPTEILHTFLLGVIKYLWHETTKPMSAANLQHLGSRLSELSHVSISGPATSQAKYISTYPNSVLGRHFKEIVQLGAFALDDLPIGNDLFQLWIDTGRLTSLIWFPRISDMDRYRRCLRRATSNVLDGFAKLFPDKILRKVKLHLLVHLEDDIRSGRHADP